VIPRRIGPGSVRAGWDCRSRRAACKFRGQTAQFACFQNKTQEGFPSPASLIPKQVPGANVWHPAREFQLPFGDAMLAKVYAYLSKISPIAVLVMYLALIPTFAIVFCVLPDRHFYAPYARMEPPALADATAVKKNITAAMVRSYTGHNYSADEWQIARSDIQTDDLETDPAKGLTFTVYYHAAKHEKDKIIAAVGGPQFTARLSQQKLVSESRPGWIVCHLISLPSDIGADGPATFNKHLLFRSPELALQADSICWGANEEIAMQNLLAGWSGDPRGLSGFWWRMLYFSATTITTVGFGDIVPITTTARALTAIEAIAGWLLAGLFLNSLASRIAKSHS
jgi:hypothetical protein